MKILITGLPGAGKTLISRYLHSLYSSYDLFDFENYSSVEIFLSDVFRSENCIVVIQSERFLASKFIPDRSYIAVRKSKDLYRLTDGFITNEFTLIDLLPFSFQQIDNKTTNIQNH